MKIVNKCNDDVTGSSPVRGAIIKTPSNWCFYYGDVQNWTRTMGFELEYLLIAKTVFNPGASPSSHRQSIYISKGRSFLYPDDFDLNLELMECKELSGDRCRSNVL